MATYKVIQDIEAEDKLIGPFGIRQFIYLIIVFVSLFICFRIVTAGVWFIAIPFLPIILFFGMLALPFGGEQPTETWLLAKIRFAMKPRIRIWNQDGVIELVTVTAPKKIEKALTKNLSQGEVESRLKALANTIDSRGWAIKNVNMDVFQPAYAGQAAASSDRLVDISTSPQAVPSYTVTATDDILDEQNNPTAQNLDRMISESSKARREQIVSNMRKQAQAPNPGPSLPAPSAAAASAQPSNPPADYWFMNAPQTPATPAPGTATFQGNNLVIPNSSTPQGTPGLPLQPLSQLQATPGPLSEDELLEKIHTQKQHAPKSYGNMRVIKTLEEQEADAKAAAQAAAMAPPAPVMSAAQNSNNPVTPAPDPDILELANNDDLNVETIARQAHKKQQEKDDGEVVINLH